MNRKLMAVPAAILLFIVAAATEWSLSERVAAQAKPGMPTYQVDVSWPPKLPNDWVLGDPSAVAVDRRDHVYVLHRPRTVPAEKKAQAAPAVVEFDPSGKFVNAWGGPAAGYDWPDTEHGISVDHKDRVWIGGNNPIAQVRLSPASDDMLLTFTTKGKFLKQIGGRDRSGGNKDTKNPKEPADVFVYQKTNEAFVADGYGNRRVWVIDADTGSFKRMWGAFGNVPQDPPPAPPAGSAAPAATSPPKLETAGPGPQQFGIVHSAKVSNDGFVYVADRGNRRVQIFTLDGKYQDQVFINRAGPAAATAAGLAFSPDAQQQLLYVADFGNGQVVIVNRKTLEVLGSIGGRGDKPGQFQNIHHIAVDSKGTLYSAEVAPGRRVQKFTRMATSTAAR
jgi:DNA-binding beta-propeller fold protein YncE